MRSLRRFGSLVVAVTCIWATPASGAVFTIDSAVVTLAGGSSWTSMTEAGFTMTQFKSVPGFYAEPYSQLGGGGTISCGGGPPSTTGCIENDDFSLWAGLRYSASGYSEASGGRPDTIVIKKTDNSGFTFGGFDGGESFFLGAFGAGASADAIRVTGIRADTSTFVQVFALDGLRDSASMSANGVDDLQQFASTSFFDVFVELQFKGINDPGGLGSGVDFTLDNIYLDEQINAPGVPEPGSLLLLGTGLAYAGNRLRRRRTA